MGVDAGDGHTIALPEEVTNPFVFNSPHSGRVYPQAFLDQSLLNTAEIRKSEDYCVDLLIEDTLDLGSPVMLAHFPRAYLDVNREPYELDQRMFRDRLPPYTNMRSVRVAGGLGTIARVVAESREIYRSPLSLEEAFDRIELLYRPYHDALRKLLARTHVTFGKSVLVDCHSMPSTVRSGPGTPKADIIIGDRYGTSCSPDISHCLLDLFRARGYSVARNKPYAGGFITEHYGRPARGLHSVQIEINRGLYMDEKKLKLTPGFDRLRRDLADVFSDLIDHADCTPDAIAAE
ncbi:MAG: N-formylglutamate amidohydrolase [Pseudomonadota bacterium]